MLFYYHYVYAKARSLCHLPNKSLLYVNGNKRACVCSNVNASANLSVSMSECVQLFCRRC